MGTNLVQHHAEAVQKQSLDSMNILKNLMTDIFAGDAGISLIWQVPVRVAKRTQVIIVILLNISAIMFANIADIPRLWQRPGLVIAVQQVIIIIFKLFWAYYGANKKIFLYLVA